MKKQNVGFAYLLLGLIVVRLEDIYLYCAGLLLGIIGLRIVISGAKDEVKADDESSAESK